MARFIQLIGPILHHPTSYEYLRSGYLVRFLSYLLAGILIVGSLYYGLSSDSILLLGVTILELAFAFLIFLQLLLRKINSGPLESRRLEMTAYCLGGAIMLLSCIYQFSEACMDLLRGSSYQMLPLTLGVVSSIAGNLLLVRLLWRNGLIRTRMHLFCRPLLGILFLNALGVLISIVWSLMPSINLDAMLGMATSIVLFVITAGVMIDAYWHLADIEKKGLKQSELETLL